MSRLVKKYNKLSLDEDSKLDSNKSPIAKKLGKTVNFTVNCNGSDIGNGVGIGNGNLNGGGGGCCNDNGHTGYTGYTGASGASGASGPDCDEPLVCDSKCNLICEQVYFEQTVTPTYVSRIGQQLTWTLKVTNISGRRIPGPIVVSSSLFGTLLLTDRGLQAGETITLIHTMILEQSDFQSNNLSSVAFVALGVPTGTPGRYNSGTRISPIVVTSVYVSLPELDVIGTIISTQDDDGKDVTLQLTLTNIGYLPIRFFGANLSNIFIDCVPTINMVGSPFRITEDKQVLLTGRILLSGESITVEIVGTNCSACPTCCLGGLPPQRCSINYRYHAEQGPLVNQSVSVPVTNA